jgi:hypothetical protein
VGARITLDFADGSTRASEIHAGSGYYSQSGAACFFGWIDANPPRKIHVRWPSGASSSHDVPPQTNIVTLSGDGT